MPAGFFQVCPDGSWVFPPETCAGKNAPPPVLGGGLILPGNPDMWGPVNPDQPPDGPTVAPPLPPTVDLPTALESLASFFGPLNDLTNRAADKAGLDGECGWCRLTRAMLPFLLLLLLLWALKKWKR